MIQRIALGLSLSLSLVATTGCSLFAARFGDPGDRLQRRGDEIVVCGQLFHTGTPVVLWTDPGGYDAYRAECKFNPGVTLPTGRNASTSPQRYGTLRRHVLAARGESLWDRLSSRSIRGGAVKKTDWKVGPT
jgi:hypothetical protein